MCELSELSELSGLDEMSERVSECLSPWRFRLAAALPSTTFFLRAALPFLGGGITWHPHKLELVGGRCSNGGATTTAAVQVPDDRLLWTQLCDFSPHFEHEACNHSSRITRLFVNSISAASGTPQTAAQGHSLYHGLP